MQEGAPITIHNLRDRLLILSKTGSPSKWGSVFLVCVRKPDTFECKGKVPFALKLQNPRDIYNNKCVPLAASGLKTELFFLRASNYLVKWSVCVHFPLSPSMFMLPRQKLIQGNKIANHASCDLVGILTEWSSNGDLKSWAEMSSSGIPFNKGIQLLVQVLMALFTLNHVLGYHHNDLHDKNILVNNMEKQRTFLYRLRVGDQKITVRLKNCSFFTKLWDFSYANKKLLFALRAFRNKKTTWTSDTHRLLSWLGMNKRYKSLKTVVSHLKKIYLKSVSYTNFFNYAMYFLAKQSSDVTVTKGHRSKRGDQSAIVSNIAPLGREQRYTLFKRRSKTTVQKRLRKLAKRQSKR